MDNLEELLAGLTEEQRQIFLASLEKLHNKTSVTYFGYSDQPGTTYFVGKSVEDNRFRSVF